MTIKKIVQLTNKKFQIVTEEQLAFALYKGELSRYHLEEGGELTEVCYRQIVEEILNKRAKLRAMYLLNAQDRTEAQLREKLTKDGHPSEVVDTAIAYVDSYHYIDDKRYAENYIQYMQGKKSRRSILFELEKRGISRDIISGVMEETTLEPEEEMIEALVEKRAGAPHKMDDKELRRIYGYLLRRGYQSQDITKVLQRYQNLA